MSEFACLMSARSNKMVRALKNGIDVQIGDICLIESEFGGDLATVVESCAEVDLQMPQLAASEEELARCGFAVERAREFEEWAGLVCKAGDRGPGSGVRQNLPEPAIRK